MLIKKILYICVSLRKNEDTVHLWPDFSCIKVKMFRIYFGEGIVRGKRIEAVIKLPCLITKKQI